MASVRAANTDSESTLWQNLLSELRKILVERFDAEELRTLCFDLGVEYDDLPGEGKVDKVRDLVSYLGRQDRITDLLEMGARMRPDISWPGVPFAPPLRTELREILVKHFDDGELRTLCFDLGVEYDGLPGEGKAGKARELVNYLERRDRIPELVEMGARMRPDISWPDVSSPLVPELEQPESAIGTAFSEDLTVQAEEPGGQFGPRLERTEALERIHLIMDSLFEVKEADAIVNPTNSDMDMEGYVSRALTEYLDQDVLEKARSSAPVELGQAVATEAGRLSVRHIIHTPIGAGLSETETIANLAQAVRAALTMADRLGDVRHIAFPAIGTGTAQVPPPRAAAATLLAVLEHLQQGSRLERVTFAFVDEDIYKTYQDVYQVIRDDETVGPATRTEQVSGTFPSFREVEEELLDRVDRVLENLFAKTGLDLRKPGTPPREEPAVPNAPVSFGISAVKAEIKVQVFSPEVGYLNMRSQPSTSGTLITRVSHGDTVTPLEPEEAVRAKVGQQGEWLHVRLDDGREVYAAAWYLKLAEEPTELPEKPPVTTVEEPKTEPPKPSEFKVWIYSPEVGYLNIRNAPSTSGALITQAQHDTSLVPLEAEADVRAKVGKQGEWIKVRLDDGQEGYGAASYFSLISARTPDEEEEESEAAVLDDEQPVPSAEKEIEVSEPTTIEEVGMPGRAERIQSIFYEMPKSPRKEDMVIIRVTEDAVILEHGDSSKRYKSPNLLATLSGLKQEQNLDPLEYGKLLFKGIIHHEGSYRYKKRPTAVGYDYAKTLANEQAGGRLRIALHVEVGPDYPAYKWEYLTDDRDETPLAVFENAPLYRLHVPTREVEVKPLKVLFAICDPIDLAAGGLADLDEVMEQNIIKDAMDPLVENELATYTILVGSETGAVTLSAIKEALQGGYHALHLLAHGVYLKRRRQYALVLENTDRRAEYIHTQDVKDMLLGRDDLHLIVLASCLSGKEDIGDALGALAPNLVGSVSSAVVAMQDYMPIKGAQIFTQRFYGDLARSGRVDMAMAATRQDLYTHERESWLWGIPTLLMSTTDGHLFTSNENREDVPPRPGYGTIKIKSYEELGGQDPTAKRAASAVEAEMHRYGYADQAMMSTLRAAIAPSLASGPPESKPIAPKQDRSASSDLLKLKLGVSLVAQDLEEHIQENSGLELPDSTLRQIASALNSGKHIILIGPHGTGKTSLAQDICSYAQENGFAAGFVLTTATADWTTFDTVGGYVPTREQTLQFRPGVFLEAINAGKWLVIDEINRAEIDKAFGELFTVLSGQSVDLPYKVRDEIVRVLPPTRRTEENRGQSRYWIPQDATSPYHYVIHPNWRIIGTMNVYDKSSLFQMSFAFMRRFAFVDVDLPPTKVYFWLVDDWLGKQGIPLQAQEEKTGRRLLELEQLGLLQRKFRTLLDREKAVSSEENPLMEQRAVGPAIVKDMIEYIGDRFKLEGQPDDEAQLSILGEAFLLYVIPQLDGLDFDGIQDIYKHVKDYFGELSTEELGQILTRIRLLYPHIKNWKADGSGDARSPQD